MCGNMHCGLSACWSAICGRICFCSCAMTEANQEAMSSASLSLLWGAMQPQEVGISRTLIAMKIHLISLRAC